VVSSVLITGGSGAFGTAFAKRMMEAPRCTRIAIFSRGEYRQFVMSQELKDLAGSHKLRFLIGDVRDRDRLKRAMNGIEVVVHAAALKRIEVGQYNPLEVVKTNVGGAVNVIEAAQDAGVKKVVALSSDKAFEPVSPYGTSKALAESIFLAANNTRGWSGPRFAVCRYGNVWRSTGSVVPVWERILHGSDTVPVTEPGCTRFFMRMGEAVDLVLQTAETMPSDIAIPDLPAYELRDLAAAMNAKMKITGLPAWEKMHESMGPGNSSDKARRMTVDELKAALRDS
jgi:UDP-N-acetylglucosamine 4,6-dehydratase